MREQGGKPWSCGLGHLVEETRLNLGWRSRLWWWPGKDGSGSHLIRALDKPNGQLWAEGHDGASPSLTSRRIAKAIGFKVLPRCIEKPLRSLVVDVQPAPR